MRNSIILILLLALAYLPVTSQQVHIMVGAGMMNYQGDLQPRRITLSQSHPYASAGVYYELSPNFYLRGGLVYGKVSADDKLQIRNRNRNLNFTTNILEAHFAGEYDLINPYEHRIIPFIAAGLAIFHFDPYTFKGNQKIYLRPLGTEGQGAPGKPKYNLNQLAIPFGGGIKFAISDDVFVRLEALLRRLSTDYLDDVSSFYFPEANLVSLNGPLAADLAFRGDELTPPLNYPVTANAIRGNAKSKDYYYTVGLSVSFRVGSGGDGNGRGGKSKLGCPVNVY